MDSLDDAQKLLKKNSNIMQTKIRSFIFEKDLLLSGRFIMTNEEAIEYLKWIRPNKPWSLDKKNTQTAIDKAIKALGQEPCVDCVSRNAISQTLNEMYRYVADELTLCDTDKKFPKNEVFIVDEVYEQIVEQLPSVTPQPTRWIPVSERLPEYDTYVLMSYSQDKMEIGYYHYDDAFYPTEYADLNETGWYTKAGDIADEPIAWMYLPKPYGAESEE